MALFWKKGARGNWWGKIKDAIYSSHNNATQKLSDRSYFGIFCACCLCRLDCSWVVQSAGLESRRSRFSSHFTSCWFVVWPENLIIFKGYENPEVKWSLNTEKVTCTARRTLPVSSSAAQSEQRHKEFGAQGRFTANQVLLPGGQEVFPHCGPLVTRGKVCCGCRLWVEEQTKRSRRRYSTWKYIWPWRNPKNSLVLDGRAPRVWSFCWRRECEGSVKDRWGTRLGGEEL